MESSRRKCTFGDAIRLRRLHTRWRVIPYQACCLNKKRQISIEICRFFGLPERIRTFDLQSRSLTRYPAEPRADIKLILSIISHRAYIFNRFYNFYNIRIKTQEKANNFFKNTLTKCFVCDIIHSVVILGHRQAVRHQTLTLTLPGFESLCPSQKIRQVSTCRIFLSKPQAWHIITTQSWISSRAATALVSHHAPACIFLRLDDIQCSALMIYRNKLRMIYKAYALIYL